MFFNFTKILYIKLSKLKLRYTFVSLSLVVKIIQFFMSNDFNDFVFYNIFKMNIIYFLFVHIIQMFFEACKNTKTLSGNFSGV